ncbi:MAG: tRNA uridine-5-carboxymethylaminomethyl(34) synthesis GTPase MnmE, partial [Calditrichaeota bacterium]|nr:tRNA uridine-5-carboxymethylaminomethyl(34) synthesis GTPase MnmE [Calditrichota bacterium]
RLSERIFAIREQILGFLALIEISLDFSEEEIEVLPLDELKIRLTETIAQIERLLDTYDYGRLLQEGIKLLILGKPNVGKSSLLNALLQRDRAIVSEIPGTTRDYIEASLELDGLAVQAVDTAGIRHTEDLVEAIGVERALKQLESADVALAVFESQRELEADDRALLEIIKQHGADVNFVLVQNKADLGQSASAVAALGELNLPLVAISARTGEGIDGLKQAIKNEIFRDSSIESEEVVVTSARHQRALEGTITALRNALEAVDLRASEEVLAVDVRLALDSLGEITGETTSEDVLNHIFANFCIGK